MPISYINELRDVIKHLHGVESSHVESVPIKETFQGKTVWEGIVEVFDLKGHLTATRAYAWAHSTDDPKKRRHVAVLHMGPVASPLLAVRAAILQEIRSAETTES
jgi:class 3 adenylate cyclase